MAATAGATLLSTELENILAKEFRLLQSLIEITKEERGELVRNAPGRLMEVVERKESQLDTLSLLEDSRRMITQQLAEAHHLKSDSVSLTTVLSYLPVDQGHRLKRMNDGIVLLVSELAELNRRNQALAQVGLEWAVSAQSYVLELLQPEMAYAPPGSSRPALEKIVLSDLDHRA